MDYFDTNLFRQQGRELIDLLTEFLQQSSGNAKTPPAEQVLKFRNEDDVYAAWKSARPGETPLSDVFRQVFRQSIRLHHPRFLGHQISPPAVVSALSGLVADVLNNGMGVYEMGMAGTALERVVVEMVAEQFGMGNSAGGFLTSGGSLGNLTALLCARNSKIPEIAIDGHAGPLPAVLVSGQAHYCVQRAATIMGWGKGGIVTVPANQRFQMDVAQLPGRLKQAQEDNRKVIAVIGSACSTATGAYDDLKAIGEFCQANDLWFHVDGAHGAAAAFSGKYRSLVDGIEMADSVVMDFHKLLLTPALTTAVVFRNGRDAYRTFSQKADYLFQEDEHDTQWHNIALRSFECTKLMMSLKVFSILAQHGFQAWDQNVTRLYDLARTLARLGSERKDVEVLVEPESSIVCYRYLPADQSASNRVNAKIRERLLQAGRFYIVQTVIDGVHWLRTTVGSVNTTEHELNELLSEVVALGRELEGE